MHRSTTTLVLLLAGVVLVLPLDRWLFGLPVPVRIVAGAFAWSTFMWRLRGETPRDRTLYLALFAPLILLALAPIHTGLQPLHLITLGSALAAAVLIPAWMLRGMGVLDFRLLPRRVDPVDVGYTLLSLPLAWLAFELYFGVLSPEVPLNWQLPPDPDTWELVKLFVGINVVGIWDELFFINTCYAVLRAMFPPRVANPAQCVIYTSVLWDMAFSGWGPVFVAILALTQGAMYERSRVLIWVLIVHLVVDYFLFQAIVSTYYPDLDVWWHP